MYLLLPNLFVYIYLFLFNFIELIIQIFFFSQVQIHCSRTTILCKPAFALPTPIPCHLFYHSIFFFFKLNTCHTFFISRVIVIHFSYNYSFLCPMICFLYSFCFFFLFKSTHLSISELLTKFLKIHNIV